MEKYFTVRKYELYHKYILAVLMTSLLVDKTAKKMPHVYEIMQSVELHLVAQPTLANNYFLFLRIFESQTYTYSPVSYTHLSGVN